MAKITVGDGARATLGHWFMKQALKGVGVMALAGALRTGYVELDEKAGGPQDGIESPLAAYFYYTFYDNPKQVIDFGMAANEYFSDKNDPQP